MNRDAQSEVARRSRKQSLLWGTGLAFASLILVPALSQRLGLGQSLTSAVRVALMKASQKA